MQHMKSKEEFNQYEFEQIELVQSSEQKSSSTGRVKYFFLHFDSTQNGEISLWKFSIKKPHLPKIVDKTLVHVLMTEICLRQTLNFRSLGVGKY